jgi:UDP-N-acetyl-D-mannosaminuronic acid transferase (WecB/TagA/CpsF family)
LLGSDVNLTDSGLVVLVEVLRSRRKLPRASGLGYFEALLTRMELRTARSTFWVMPSEAAMERNLAWLRSHGLDVTRDDCYIAPIYPRRGRVEDATLATLVEERRPKHVFVCVGGGPQEKLGLFLKTELSYEPGIHCLGAAIAFMTGEQATIPAWADRAYLGWLIRCIDDPRTFVPRYLKAFRLVYLLARYGATPPPIVTAA